MGLKTTPKAGAIVKTADGKGIVEEANLLTGKLRIKLDKTDAVVTLDKSEVEVLKDAVIRLNRNEIKALKALEDK